VCGIVGRASRVPAASRELLDVMRDRLRHRGPDDAGSWWSTDGTVGLAMRRLAVVDLSPAGHQPMTDVSGRFQLVFNGEIYNHRELRDELQSKGRRFRGHSDSEVLLEAFRAWGSGCLDYLNGMFAFAVYDAQERELVLARDRIGEKPLFYRHAEGGLVFASELKALLADPGFPRQLEPEGLAWYLSYGYVPGHRCILRGVSKLPPGHALRYRVASDAVETWPYWTLPEPVASPAPDARALAEELRALLLDSVRRRLVADVPVGVLLSGGIDSSLVAALATEASSSPIRTFTISFPGHGPHDEGPYAAAVARHLGTEHTELQAEPATVELLPRLAEQYDEPIADSSMVPTYLVSRLIRQHATVALGGDGGDELFGGYPHYSWLLQQERIRRLVPAPLRRLAAAAAAHLLPTGFRGRNHLIGFGGDLASSIAHVNVYFDAVAQRQLLGPEVASALAASAPEESRRQLCRSALSPLQQATRVDFSGYLPEDILVKVDRASMLASLEVRAPWLDHRIVELAFSRVPDRLRATAGERKVLPRLLAEHLLPRGMDLRRKQGFSLPLRAWFRGDWGRAVAAILAEADPHLFRRREIESLIAGQRRGLSNTARLFALATFELWRRHYRVAVG
jgi:asparagine synthase (glutamine-hydrolysing)